MQVTGVLWITMFLVFGRALVHCYDDSVKAMKKRGNPVDRSQCKWRITKSTIIKGSNHYLGDKTELDVYSEGPTFSTISQLKAFSRVVEFSFIVCVLNRLFVACALVLYFSRLFLRFFNSKFGVPGISTFSVVC